MESIQTKKTKPQVDCELAKTWYNNIRTKRKEIPKMLCNTVNVMSFAEYSYESEFSSYERSFISHTPRQAKTDHVQMRCVF